MDWEIYFYLVSLSRSAVSVALFHLVGLEYCLGSPEPPNSMNFFRQLFSDISVISSVSCFSPHDQMSDKK